VELDVAAKPAEAAKVADAATSAQTARRPMRFLNVIIAAIPILYLCRYLQFKNYFYLAIRDVMGSTDLRFSKKAMELPDFFRISELSRGAVRGEH
jgi:hypothetical protein